MPRDRVIPALAVLIALPVLCSGNSNYSRLRPSSDYWDKRARKVPVHISRLSRDRSLAAVGNTLYMLDARRRIVWTWSTKGPPLTDWPIVDSTGTVYVIAFDLTWVGLDSVT